MESVNLEWSEHEHMPSVLNTATFTVSNAGDLPEYVTRVHMSINEGERSSATGQVLVPAEETESIKVSALSLPVESGTYTANFEFKKIFWGQIETVATYTETITVP